MHLTPTLCFLAVSTATAAAQCEPDLTAFEMGGANDIIRASTYWDPDGAGPLPAQLVVGGEFTRIGNTEANHVALFDDATQTWQQLDNGIDGDVLALAVTASGDLLVGGRVTIQGVDHSAARFGNGTWTGLGLGLGTGLATAIVEAPNGDVIIADSSEVASWDGVSWTAIGTGGFAVRGALDVLPTGEIVAVGPVPTGVAVWDGTSWDALDPPFGTKRDVSVSPDGDIVVASSNEVISYDGTVWTEYPIYGQHQAVHALSGGRFWVGGGSQAQTSAGVEFSIAYWNGSEWQSTSPLFHGDVQCISESPLGQITVAGGVFGGGLRSPIVTWDGSAWSTLTNGLHGPSRAIELDNAGDLVLAGRFDWIADVRARSLAKFDGTGFESLLAPDIYDASLSDVLVLPNGHVLAAGSLYLSASDPPLKLPYWDGISWSNLGDAQPDLAITTLLRSTNGDVIVGGFFNTFGTIASGCVARWDGTTWDFYGAQLDGSVRAMIEYEGELLVGGQSFASAGSPMAGLARWNGAAWTDFHGSTSWVYSLIRSQSGELIVGSFGVERWDGTAWHDMGPVIEPVTALTELANGDLIAATRPYLGGGPPQVWHHDGTTWNVLAICDSGEVFDMLVTDDAIWIAGEFETVNGEISAGLARLDLPCVATNDTVGAGCVNSAGTLTATADRNAWIGATPRATAGPFPWPSIAMSILAFETTSIPVQALLPEGLPGCDLLVVPHRFDLSLPSDGRAAVEAPLPADPTLVGAEFFAQFACLELDANGGIDAISTSNAVHWTVGALQ